MTSAARLAGGSAASRPCISVIVPSFQRRESLLQVVEAVCQQTYARERYEIIVVLDGSRDGSREAIEQRDWPVPVRVLWQANQGAARARNHGAAIATGELLVFVDDDVVPEPGWLAAHARAYRARPGAAVVLGRMTFSAPVPHSVVAAWEAEWYVRHFEELAAQDRVFTCWDFFAGNVSITREAFHSVGGFDEAFTSYGCEDWELGFRLLERRYPFAYCAEAAAEHRYQLDFDGWLRHAYWDGRSEVRFARKHPGIKAALQLGVLYRGSLRRRLGRRALSIAPWLWRPMVHLLARAYLRAESAGWRRSAMRLARVLWTYEYWSGMCDELGGPRAVHQFVGFQVPILVYHRVAERPHPALREFAIEPARFRRHLRWLRATRRPVVSLEQVYDAYRGAASLPDRAVAITFDDGYWDTRASAAPVLREFGCPATIFIVADLVGADNRWDAEFGPPSVELMDWPEVCELAAVGFDIGGHSATHPRLPDLSDTELDDEVRRSRAVVERRLRRSPRWFAYPYGEHDQRVRAATRAAGYLAAFAYDAGLADACDDLFALPRIPIDGRDGVVGLAIKLAAGEDGWTSIKRRTPPALKRLARFLNRISTYPSQHD